MIPRVLRGGGLAGRTVLLVDDVLTTGTTTNECARILKRTAGVEKVVVITVARG
jgi:predicted amidophosphoribosyltransferase